MWREAFFNLGKGFSLLKKVEIDFHPVCTGCGRCRQRALILPPSLISLAKGRLSRAALAAAAATGQALLNRPGIRLTLESALLNFLRSRRATPANLEAVALNADKIASILRAHEIIPKRLGVDGLPGSGKSTLARALANRLEMQWQPLDGQNMDVPQAFSTERAVYEHHRLFRTQDVDAFDALIYVDEPIEAAKKRVLERAVREAREALIVDLLDFRKLKTIGRLAFEVCDGPSISVPGSNLFLKLKPPQGFRAREHLAERLPEAYKTNALKKEALLFLVAYGKPQAGITAYLIPSAYNQELLAGLLAGLQAYLAG
jgi:hypothetical protein